MRLLDHGRTFVLITLLEFPAISGAVDSFPSLIWKMNLSYGDYSRLPGSMALAYSGCGTEVGSPFYLQNSSPKAIADAYCEIYARYNACEASKGFLTHVGGAPSTYHGFKVTEFTDTTGYSYQFKCTGWDLTGYYSVGAEVSKGVINAGLDPKNNGGSCPFVGNPINPANGNKYQFESLYSGIPQLSFSMSYNSAVDTEKKQLGTSWRSVFDRAVFADALALTNQLSIRRPDGKAYGFKNVSGVMQASSDKTYSLTRLTDASGNTTGWIYIDDFSGETESYNDKGILQSITARDGKITTFTYSTSSTSSSIAPTADLLINVSDSLGRLLNFKYDSNSRLSIMTNPQGGSYTFVYDNTIKNNLISVTFSDSSIKGFLYESTSFRNALTGITDENVSRFATWNYDARGRAISSEHAGGVGKVTLAYSANGPQESHPLSTTVTTVGTSAINTFNLINSALFGVIKTTRQSQPAGSGCAASASSLTYDVNGNVASRIDFNGNKTTYVYDLTRNVETSRTEGLTTAGAATTATRTTTTSWHATWRLPLVVSVYTGATASGTPVQRTTYTYDTKGNITSVLEEDPVRSLSRTTTTTYTYSSAVPGLILQKVVNGPRTDVTDTTTYEYYPHDATCTASTATPIVDPITGVAPANYGCRGQLKQVTNALGHITTYDRYNHHGQLEQMTDANGLVTQQTYDLRQRLLTRTVSGSGITTQTTQLTYDNVGQITQLKMPDNSTLSYTYDAAHRLTDIQDTLGNKVHYTLDTEGNRIQEDVYDPNNALSTTLTRSFDALNRLQTQTGL